ncbi:hypothetical protein [Streptomyces chryseus]
MSDSQDETMRYLAQRLTTTYTGLIATCALLPVAITLPEGEVTNLEAVPAVRRVMEIADEQPMPEEHQAELFTGATMWLAAMDLYALLVKNEYAEARASGALGILLIANDALQSLGHWLLETMD